MVSVNDIAAWRTRIFSSLLSVVLGFGTFAAAVSIPLLLEQGLWPVVLVDVVALAWIFALRRLTPLPYRLRVLNFLAIVYAVAVALMLSVGPISLVYLLCPPVMAAILLGTRPAMLALALGSATIVALGGSGHIAFGLPAMEHTPLRGALAVSMNYASVGAMLALTCSAVLKGLSLTLGEVRTSAATLEARQAELGRLNGELERTSAAIHRLAYYDVLTGLPNRRLLMERLALLVAQADAGRGLGAVLYLDLDNFKNVNDARGHATGDALLEQAAARLVRVLDGRGTVARLGGDEFVVLLDALGTDPAAATRAALALADAICAALAASMDIGGQAYQISASVGVALPLRAGASADDLLREADTAMYHTKAGGRNGVALFEPAMLRDAQRKLTLERDLAQALERGELAMHLQLQVDHAGAPAGAELLMRWQRADGSSVRPDEFIPAAESSGLIVPLGRWVLRQACAAWLALARAGHPLPLSINVSPLQFRQPDFVEQVRAILQETGTPPGQLIFEVTEGLLVADIGQAIGRMRELAALGIRFSIDDFGTGYSNLAYLKQMPLYELKIDKSFMRDTPHDPSGTAIVQSILAMAGHLGLRVVAEGIETEEQARYLAGHGRPHMQGYLYHRPMALDGLIAQLNATVPPAHGPAFAQRAADAAAATAA